MGWDEVVAIQLLLDPARERSRYPLASPELSPSALLLKSRPWRPYLRHECVCERIWPSAGSHAGRRHAGADRGARPKSVAAGRGAHRRAETPARLLQKTSIVLPADLT